MGGVELVGTAAGGFGATGAATGCDGERVLAVAAGVAIGTNGAAGAAPALDVDPAFPWSVALARKVKTTPQRGQVKLATPLTASGVNTWLQEGFGHGNVCAMDPHSKQSSLSSTGTVA
jgi:hypothetical protein